MRFRLEPVTSTRVIFSPLSSLRSASSAAMADEASPTATIAAIIFFNCMVLSLL
jgi:hypothetical protein